MAVEAHPFETGGILIGWHEDDTIVVTHVLQVGDHRVSRHDYVRNDKAAQAALDDFRCTSPDANIGYVGEWHSHPAQQPPSQTDYGTLRDLAHDTGRHVGMAVFAVTDDGSVIPYLATASKEGESVSVHRLWETGT